MRSYHYLSSRLRRPKEFRHEIYSITKEFISKTTLSVIPACLESFLKKDAGQASMTEYLYACDFTYGLISK